MRKCGECVRKCGKCVRKCGSIVPWPLVLGLGPWSLVFGLWSFGAARHEGANPPNLEPAAAHSRREPNASESLRKGTRPYPRFISNGLLMGVFEVDFLDFLGSFQAS